MKLLDTFDAARQAGTPLIAINCSDPEATMDAITEKYKDTRGIIQWDIVRGYIPRNPLGKKSVDKIVNATTQEATMNPVEGLTLATQIEEKSVLFYINGHKHLERPDYIQAVWNLRDNFKSSRKSLVILSPGIQLPEELQQDFLVINEPLPTEDELRIIVQDIIDSANLPEKVPEQVVNKAIDALRGVSAFPAEQATAMCMSKQGLNVVELWERKRQLIDSTPGLSVWRGADKFSDIGGVNQVKTFTTKILNGVEAPRVIVFIDEIEKMMAGATSGNDSTGVSQDQLGVLLSEMENKRYSGMIYVGPPGAAKSAVAKAAGNEVNIPTITLDLGGMKNSLVGSSETRIRQALKIIDSVGGGQAMFIATCNKLTAIPPELKRRFTMGTFFFDLPSKKERDKIWSLYMTKYGQHLEQTIEGIDDDGWTGAEIKQCCLLSYRLQISLKDASTFIVPVYKSAYNDILALRQEASGKFLSASDTGIYYYSDGKQSFEKSKKASRVLGD